MFTPLNIAAREKELHYILIKDTPIPSVPMHWHSEFEITYAVKGSFRCLIGSMEHQVTEGNAIISISGEKHYFFPAPETKVIRILFSPDILSGTPDDEELIRKVEESLKSSTRTTAMWPEKGKKELNELISWLASGNDDRKSPSYCLGARGGVLIMLSLFTRYAEPIDSESTVLSSDDKVMERIGKVFELVGSSYDKDITLSAAADAAGYALERLRLLVAVEEHARRRAEADAHQARGALVLAHLDDAVRVALERLRRADGDARAALRADIDIRETGEIVDLDP